MRAPLPRLRYFSLLLWCQGLNLGHLHARQVPYPVCYCFGPTDVSLQVSVLFAGSGTAALQGAGMGKVDQMSSCAEALPSRAPPVLLFSGVDQLCEAWTSYPSPPELTR